MALFNPVSVNIATQTSSTATPSTVASSANSQTLLAANANRKGLTIWNDSTGNLFIDFHDAVSTTEYAVKISAGGYYEMPFGYTGIISGIWDAVNGNALVRELV